MRKWIGVGMAAALAACGGSSSGGGPGTAGSDPHEPNDTIAQATPIAATSTTAATIGSATDHDYYSFDVPAGGGILREMTFDGTGTGCVASLCTTIDLYSAAGALLATSDPLINPPLNSCSDLLAFLPEGKYAVDVRDAGCAKSTYPAAYKLVSQLATPPATPYTATAAVSGSITATTMYDCYAVQNTGTAAVPVRLQTWVGGVNNCTAPNNDTVLRVLDLAGAVVASNDDGGVPFCSLINYTLPAAATRYACVTAYPGTTVPSYQLDIAF